MSLVTMVTRVARDTGTPVVVLSQLSFHIVFLLLFEEFANV